ncbi:histone deacetylase family protein [Sphingomonas sp. Leaf10]|uniref:histone deacetylase family protein n=1 Tax=Sphingomonas sp. Leaf10 TaxID=1735676 RepID=UPI000701D5AA|nr:histone deacetylase family protein [Sphingomonas sp. Leaf10]KQM36411.1 acetylpolyamine aminohydrolase [Sphingomonas sp. Leaf10]
MKCFFDDRQLCHAPEREFHNGGWAVHAETPERAQSIMQALGQWEVPRDHGIDPIAAVHDARYLDFLQAAWSDWIADGRTGEAIGYAFPVRHRRTVELTRIDARLGAFSMDASTPITAGSWDAAYWGAQCAVSAVEALAEGARNSFALCRPPGHHAGADYLGGYCFLNNAAIAARHAMAAGLGPVAVLDVDYHHGNGTQDIFLEDDAVFFASIHADPRTDYPFHWGHGDERGEGAGTGATLNLPLPRGTDWDGYRPALAQALAAIADWGARTLVVSFGADTYAHDPIAGFALETEDFGEMGRMISAAELPTAIVMEGGYAVEALGANVAAFLTGIEGGEGAT